MDILESVKQTCQLLRKENPDSRSRKLAELALRLRLGQSSDVEKLLQSANESEKKELWSLIREAVEISHGEGFVFTQHGVTRSLAAHSAERRQVMLSSINQFLLSLERQAGVKCFFTSGTLLGIIREGDLIGHDDDIDTCYVSNTEDLFNLGLEWYAIRHVINMMEGCEAKSPFPGLLHVTIPCGPSRVRFDLFTSISLLGRFIQYPLNTTLLETDDVLPLQSIEFFGESVRIPRNPRKHLTANYGPGWTEPDPSFRFDWDRAAQQFRDVLNALRTSPLTGQWLIDHLRSVETGEVRDSPTEDVLLVDDGNSGSRLGHKPYRTREMTRISSDAVIEEITRRMNLAPESLCVVNVGNIDLQAKFATTLLALANALPIRARAIGRNSDDVVYKLQPIRLR